MTDTISVVSLNGARSNVIPPGAISKQNPKSGTRVSGYITFEGHCLLTDVNDMPSVVNHDVSIVAILKLQKIRDD